MTVHPSVEPDVVIRDVGPRDGLQPEAPVAPDLRARLINSLIDAGVRRIEIAAFVSPKAVPAMAGADEVFGLIEAAPGLIRTALVPNLKGAQMALGAGAEELTVTISASEAYNQRNVKMSTAQSAEVIAQIVAAARQQDDGPEVPVDAVISCAFGSPYECDIAPGEVVELAHKLLSSGVNTITYADTTGMATPRRVIDLLTASEDGADELGASNVGMHFHDTRGTALVNAYASLEAGVKRFDTAVGGVGGSPFAHGAGGNLATEALVAMLDDLGVTTGISVEGLMTAAAIVEELIGRSVPSGVAHHGPRDARTSY